MEYPEPGGLDDIRARAATRRPPEPEEVEIRVHATGLNFIDAMRACTQVRAMGRCAWASNAPAR
jgi:NADPH:quinone reductase-like Zn-dependent oxidoreductase